jgi:quercetin dioxygenase-like cupin family protein
VKRTVVIVLCVLVAFALGGLHERVRGQAPPRMSAESLLDHRTDQIPTPTRVQVMHNRWEPGAETGRHSHPGPVVFIVLEGELEEEVWPGGERRTLEAGQVDWKPVPIDHNVRNVTDRMARAVVVHLDPAPSR